MKQLLTQNTKMKKSSQNGITVVNWTIPAFQSSTGLKTCPNAGVCAIGCYARSGTYLFSNVKSAHEEKLALTQSDTFVELMISEIETWLKKKNVSKLYIRIHDAGDFYNVSYWNKWRDIMSHFENNDKVKFYAYTKQVKMFQNETNIPLNFQLIFSFGGKQDRLINLKRDSHAKVFESIEELESSGYVDGTNDDLIAARGEHIKIGLCYHGTKNYQNTAWNKVS